MNDTVGRRNPQNSKFQSTCPFPSQVWWRHLLIRLTWIFSTSEAEQAYLFVCLLLFSLFLFLFRFCLLFLFCFVLFFFLVFNFCFCFVFWQKLRVTLIVAAREPLDWSYFLTHSNYLSVSASKMSGEQYHRSHRKIRRLCRLPQSPA